MTDEKKPLRKKIPTLQELDDMPEGVTGQPADSSKGQPARSKANRSTMRVRKGVGQKKKVVRVPSVNPKSKSTSKPEKTETAAKHSDYKSSESRVTSIKIKKATPRDAKKPPASEPLKQSQEPSHADYDSHDEYPHAMALSAARARGHHMGPFKELPNDGGRNRTYESKCVKCGGRAISKVVFYENLSNRFSDIRASGEATEGPCSSKPRRRLVTKTTTKTRSDPKVSRNQISRQTSGKPPSGARVASGHHKSSHPLHKSSRKTPSELEFTKPSLERILSDKARDEARRKAKERGHRINEFVLFAYPGAGGYTVYRGQCAKCQRVVLGMVKHHPEDPSKSSIVVSGDILEHRCSGVAAMPKTQPITKRGKAKAPIRSVKFKKSLSAPVQEEPAPESRKLSDRQKVYKKARMIARSDAKEKGHQMGRFNKLPDDGGRDRSYESKCVKCGGRAIGKADFLPDYPDNMGQPRAFGSATEGNCPLPS